ncbi:hypothetical protein T4B_4341 [Trichinella pseudospiralis]|uniref:Uncharacterized protein n=1 Tax=Trichinella pseudospiralis TaxID=6337 RepID=A0A0V1HCI3_TRIPS|nr:hypothetical protein T4B_1441 [Trichinella pseudospiralis]KRZ08170.1 hypothetical protein T4B_3523 [Trichinella pseudospiralis]KRZ08173.1 hypothetical protein T4B_4341 [Trichinella pseudospiralis]
MKTASSEKKQTKAFATNRIPRSFYLSRANNVYLTKTPKIQHPPPPPPAHNAEKQNFSIIYTDSHRNL